MPAPSLQKPKQRLQGSNLFLLVIGIVALNAAITQYLAFYFHFHPALGPPLYGAAYNPFAWIAWQWRFYDQARLVFGIASIASLLGYSAIFLGLTFRMGLSRRSHKHDGLHGTAHWADEKEIRKTGLIPSGGKSGQGVYVGAWVDKQGRTRYLRHDGPEHIAAIAPTRSGKGVGLVIPTLLSWPHSAVIHDMKGELWALTAGWRQQSAGNKVLKFDPAAEIGSCAFNPLDEVRLGEPSEVADVQNLVTIIVDPDGKGLNDHWTKTAHAFLTGVTLHLLYKAKLANAPTATLSGIAFALSDPNHDIKALYEEMLTATPMDSEEDDPENPGQKKKVIHSVVAAAARDMLNRPEQERGSVLSSAMSYLALYRDKLVADNTSRSDFRISDLMNHKDPVSLYLVVRPADKDRLKPLMRLILNQIVRTLTRDEMKFKNGQAQKSFEHRLLLMLDEFPSFGKLEVFQEALAFIAGYGIKAYLIMQDISQLRASYTHDESILSNCHVRVAYAPNKPETAEWLSRMTGTSTVTVEDISTSGHRFGAVLQNVSQSYHSVARPLLTPDECMRIPGAERNGDVTKPGDMLIFTAGFSPIYGTQILYFNDPTFKERAAIPMPKDTDRLNVASRTGNVAPKVLQKDLANSCA